MENKGIRFQIFLLFSIMGIVPFVILVIVVAYNSINELESNTKETSLLKNAIVSEHVSNLIEKNRCVLDTLSLNPHILEYIKDPTEEGRKHIAELMLNSNEIFNDGNLMALTGSNGWQLIRTDNSTLVNLKRRRHFIEGMRGKPYVSDIISSMSTGKMIIVLSVPIIDDSGKAVGLLQRNYDLSALQAFVNNYDTGDGYIIVLDRVGRVISHSEKNSNIGTDIAVDETYKKVLNKIYNTNGAMLITLNNEKVLATYSRNIDTGWMIITVLPYHFIFGKVYSQATILLTVGLLVMIIGVALAYFLTMRVTQPIIEITKAVDKIAEGDTSIEKLEINRDDELGKMAAAFNKLRSERDNFQLESELDKLTELFNKKTIENLCRMKLKTFSENESSNIFMAFYIIDLDHFKEVNDILGHQFGDRVLIEFSKELKKIFRPNDCIGRFGGDEFIVILDSLPNMEVVIRKAEQIKQIAYNLTLDGRTHFVSASIGIAIAPQNGRDYETLFSAADKALYHVKNNGKNGYHCSLFDNGKK
ncbi:MAG: diguanylate cyclase [Selenomonadaceae bacterium]|nr:diguanylate cyclase [Selenomonadaceae bacterium]